MNRAPRIGLRAVFAVSASLLLVPRAFAADRTIELRVFLLSRDVGRETTVVREGASGDREYETSLEFVDRGGPVSLKSTLVTSEKGAAPRGFTAKGRTYRFVNVDVNQGVIPNGSFPGRGYAPLAGRAELIRFWAAHGRKSDVPLAGNGVGARANIRSRGTDVFVVDGREQSLRRYEVDGMVWGRETVWLDAKGDLAAIVTRVHILPLTAVRSEFAAHIEKFQASAIQDRIRDLEEWRRLATVVQSNEFAIVSARILKDASAPIVEDGVIVVRNGMIAAMGSAAATPIDNGVRKLDARGATVIPGLFDMHAHASQIEWAPAYLAAGVTSIRDMGGEENYLVAFRDSLNSGRGLGPRVYLAGLIEGPGEDGFGTTVVANADEARAAVDHYVLKGFAQMKVYSLISLDLLKAITARAHEKGITVTGHVPRGLTPEDVAAASMDNIAHMPIGGDPDSAAMRSRIAFLASKHTVVDPTLAWNELLGRGASTPIDSFEPGIARISPPLAMNYESVRNPDAPSRVAAQGRALKAMRDAGVRIVAGTDGAVPGFSLLRELELYAAAGMTPREAIASATTASAETLGLSSTAGSLAVGRPADFVVLDGDPTIEIGALRKRRYICAAGRLYDPRALERLAFR